jgi:hypothetical protein
MRAAERAAVLRPPFAHFAALMMVLTTSGTFWAPVARSIRSPVSHQIGHDAVLHEGVGHDQRGVRGSSAAMALIQGWLHTSAGELGDSCMS